MDDIEIKVEGTVFVRGAWFRVYEIRDDGTVLVGRTSGFRFEVKRSEIEQAKTELNADIAANQGTRQESRERDWGRLWYLPRRTR